MVEAADMIEEFIRGRRRSDLDHDRMLIFAGVRANELIGEAASKVSAETPLANPDIPWTEMVAMRNRLVLAYFEIDSDILWKTAIEEIPDLRARLGILCGG